MRTNKIKSEKTDKDARTGATPDFVRADAR